jgi:hypothetical protein
MLASNMRQFGLVTTLLIAGHFNIYGPEPTRFALEKAQVLTPSAAKATIVDQQSKAGPQRIGGYKWL